MVLKISKFIVWYYYERAMDSYILRGIQWLAKDSDQIAVRSDGSVERFVYAKCGVDYNILKEFASIALRPATPEEVSYYKQLWIMQELQK